VRDFKPGDSRHDYFQDRVQTYTNSRIVSATSGTATARWRPARPAVWPRR